jgi:hypothetical protein
MMTKLVLMLCFLSYLSANEKLINFKLILVLKLGYSPPLHPPQTTEHATRFHTRQNGHYESYCKDMVTLGIKH